MTERNAGEFLTKREFLKAGAVGGLGVTSGCLRLNEGSVATATPEETATRTPTASVTVLDQTTDGNSITIAQVETEADVTVRVADSTGTLLGADETRVQSGTERENIRIELAQPLTAEQELSVSLVWCQSSGSCDGPVIASDDATVSVEQPAEETPAVEEPTETERSSEEPTEEPTDDQDMPTATVTVADQTTDGGYVTVERARTTAEAVIQVYDSEGNFIGSSGKPLLPGETIEDRRIEFTRTLTRSQIVQVKLFWCKETGAETCDGPEIATDEARITVESPTEESDSETGFTVIDGEITSAAGVSLDGYQIQIFETTDQQSYSLDIEDGGFVESVKSGGKVNITFFYNESDYVTDFDGVPVLYALEEGLSVSGEEVRRSYELPQAYRTQIKCVDGDGAPVEGLPVNLRAANGSGMGPGRLTTDADGYIKFEDESRTGVDLVGRVTVGIHSRDQIASLKQIKVTEQREFTVTVFDPERYL